MGRIVLGVDARIVLKQYSVSDSRAIFELIDDNRSHLSQYGDITARKYSTMKEVHDSIAHPKNPERLRFGIWDEGVFVGTINITPDEDDAGARTAEVGYFLGESHQGRGCMGKSLARIIQYAFFKMDIQIIYALVARKNRLSANVLQRAGFRRKNIQNDQQIFYLERNQLNRK